MPFDYRNLTHISERRKNLTSFFDCKDEKITEKAFLQSVTISVIGILLCIVSLCSATYAWFTSNVNSNSNTLTSGSFDLDVFIKQGENVSFTDSDAAISKNADGTVSYIFEASGTYTVKLAMSDGANVKGYCKIHVGGENITTSSISKDEDVGVDPLTFTITTAEPNTEIIFTPCWGYPASSTLVNGSGITVGTASGSDGNG